MIRRITSITIALMIMTAVCACGNVGKDSSGQLPQEEAVSENVSEEQVTGDNNIQGQEPVENGEGIDTNVSNVGEQQEIMEAMPQETEEVLPQQTGEEIPQDAVPQESVDSENTESGQEMTQEDWDKLAAIGDVQLENGIMTVSLTVPADLAQYTTQETIDAGIGTQYQSAVRNEDGSITYKMTKAQHQAMVEQLAMSFDRSLQELVDDENHMISNITRNDDFTVFDVTLDGTELAMSDAYTAFGLYMYGDMFGVFNGSRPEHVIVNYYDPNGNLIDSGDSATMHQQQP